MREPERSESTRRIRFMRRRRLSSASGCPKGLRGGRRNASRPLPDEPAWQSPMLASACGRSQRGPRDSFPRAARSPGVPESHESARLRSQAPAGCGSNRKRCKRWSGRGPRGLTILRRWSKAYLNLLFSPAISARPRPSTRSTSSLCLPHFEDRTSGCAASCDQIRSNTSVAGAAGWYH